MFAVCEALMLYTHAWGIFFGAGSVLALIPIWLTSDDRRGVVRDARARVRRRRRVLFLPWLPNFIYQATHTGAPWAPTVRFGAPVLLSRDLLGGDRITVAARARCDRRARAAVHQARAGAPARRR